MDPPFASGRIRVTQEVQNPWTFNRLSLRGGLPLVSDRRRNLTCSLAVFLLALLCWHRGWLGGGDVKLLGATAFLLPPDRVPGFILAVALAGGVLAAVYLLLERIVPAPRLRMRTSFLLRVCAVECRRINRRSSLPYATAISAAAILTLVER